MLHQDATMTHSWFVKFDKDFNSQLPLWFIHWWKQFGHITDIFLRPLTSSFKYFTLNISIYCALLPPLWYYLDLSKFTSNKKNLALYIYIYITRLSIYMCVCVCNNGIIYKKTNYLVIHIMQAKI